VTPTPTVSVCVPTFNGAQFVERTIRSVLAQTWGDYELVVSDDGSTDATLDILDRIDDSRLRVVAGEGRAGAAANFNRAVGLARGKYVKLLCQDDLLYPECLERQVAAMEAGARSGVVLVACRRDIVDDHDRVIYRHRGWRGAQGVISGGRAMRANVRAGTNLIGEPSAVLCSRTALDEVGGFSVEQSYMIDLEAWMRLLDHGNLSYLPESLCTFRVSQDSWSSKLRREQARQARRVLRALRVQHPATVTRGDLAIGWAKPTLLALARRGIFATSRILPTRSGPRALPAAVDSADVP
jgi:glycosyltransferase involved in cell wall biosynthesis